MWIGRYWLQLTLLFLLLGILAGSGPLTGLAVFLLAAGCLARFWSRHAFDRVRYERIVLENRAFAGETFDVTLRLSNDKLLPLPLVELREAVPASMIIDEAEVTRGPSPDSVYLKRSTHMTWYERVNWPVQLRAGLRGYYRIGPGRLSSGDVFGFFPVQREEDGFEPLIVYPRLYTLPELGLPAERPFGERKGRERIFEDPSRSAGLRDYRPGDPMRRIDWKASARRQALQSRVYEPSSTLHMLIALNVHTLEHTWQGYVPELLERLISLTGSVAQYGFDAGYAVGLTANGSFPESDRPMRIPAGRRSDQLMKILEALAVIGPLTLFPLETVLAREAQSFPFGATLVCITARLDEPLVAALQHIAAAGHTVTVLSLASVEATADLGRITVINLSETMKNLELAGSVAAIGGQT